METTVNFIDALTSGRPMRRTAWLWGASRWTILPVDSLDHDWLAFDDGAPDRPDGLWGEPETWFASDRLRREDFLADDWEIWVSDETHWLAKALSETGYKKLSATTRKVRTPSSPDKLVGARHDRVHEDRGPTRSARSVKVKRKR